MRVGERVYVLLKYKDREREVCNCNFLKSIKLCEENGDALIWRLEKRDKHLHGYGYDFFFSFLFSFKGQIPLVYPLFFFFFFFFFSSTNQNDKHSFLQFLLLQTFFFNFIPSLSLTNAYLNGR